MRLLFNDGVVIFTKKYNHNNKITGNYDGSYAWPTKITILIPFMCLPLIWTSNHMKKYVSHTTCFFLFIFYALTKTAFLAIFVLFFFHEGGVLCVKGHVMLGNIHKHSLNLNIITIAPTQSLFLRTSYILAHI